MTVFTIFLVGQVKSALATGREQDAQFGVRLIVSSILFQNKILLLML